MNDPSFQKRFVKIFSEMERLTSLIELLSFNALMLSEYLILNACLNGSEFDYHEIITKRHCDVVL